MAEYIEKCRVCGEPLKPSLYAKKDDGATIRYEDDLVCRNQKCKIAEVEVPDVPILESK